MNRIRSFAAAAVAALIVVLPGSPNAQDITDAHLQAAWAAVLAIGADEGFDDALPDLATQVQGIMSRRRPDLYAQITDAVYAVAGELVVRRLELNNDVARAWAMQFTEAELNGIVAFYTSPVGVKLTGMLPQMQDATLEVFEAWYDRLGTEMLERAVQELERRGISY